VAKGSSWGTIGFLQPSPETEEQSALSPETEEQSALSPETGEPIGSLPDRQKEAACPQGLDPDFGGPFMRTSRARALRPKPGPARRGEASERERMFFFLPLTHTCKSMESIQLFKLGSLHLH
jgi:hypothetical protein